MNALIRRIGFLVAVAFPLIAPATSPAAAGPAASSIVLTAGPQSRNAGPDTNPEGIAWSAVDVTMGIGPVAKTLPSAPDKDVAGIPLTVVDRILGWSG